MKFDRINAQEERGVARQGHGGENGSGREAVGGFGAEIAQIAVAAGEDSVGTHTVNQDQYDFILHGGTSFRL